MVYKTHLLTAFVDCMCSGGKCLKMVQVNLQAKAGGPPNLHLFGVSCVVVLFLLVLLPLVLVTVGGCV
jgi:hypothetical protein